MKITFKINYRTCYGQQIAIEGLPGKSTPVIMTPQNDGDWILEHQIDYATTQPFQYRYMMIDNNIGTTLYEYGWRNFHFPNYEPPEIFIQEFWKPTSSPLNAMYSSAFKSVIFNRKNQQKVERLTNKTEGKISVRASIPLVRVKQENYVAIKFIGRIPEDNIIVPLNDELFPIWSAEFTINKPEQYTEYKYCICNKQTNRVALEEYLSRYFQAPVGDNAFYFLNDEDFKFPRYPWKGAGVAVPVFSLRSKEGLGVGEFLDLIKLIDWAKATGLRMIQLLPVNDTIQTHTYTDSYPYGCLSVFALHPIYLRVSEMGELTLEAASSLQQHSEELNQLEKIDYEQVMTLKSRLFKVIYDKNKRAFLQDPEYQKFFEKNKDWLKPYAVFSYLRDLNSTADFSKWGEYAKFSQSFVNNLCQPDSESFDDIAIHFFIQYHLHLQLKKVSDYARENGIVLKGDIPIGIIRNSVDAWVNPNLYHLDQQAGAPPDDFSEDGQNWGFPTYNWDEMAKDGFAWWKARLKKMSEYFDAYRIDHILGFFRIWSISTSQTRGILGVFNPVMPIDKKELTDRGVTFNYERFCTPYVREHMLRTFFNEDTGYVIHCFFEETTHGCFKFKEEFNTQQKIESYFKRLGVTSPEDFLKFTIMKQKLLHLSSEVLFIQDPNNPDKIHPRHTLFKTYSYKELDPYARQVISDIYNDYYYHRSENLWKRQAEIKLPALIESTDMLVCGEDLGMIPACVPEVMKELNILSLEIQRMPKEPRVEFGRPASYPYLSVATPSSHDTSVIRAWWEEDRERSKRFYNTILGQNGDAPYYCETNVVKEIIYQHLYSPAMWAVFPIQDLLGMDEVLRYEKPQEERINIPSESNHYWCYRCHISTDTLLAATNFNGMLRSMLHISGRDEAY